MSEYEQRKRAGKVALMVWIDEDIGEELKELMLTLDRTKTRVVEDAVMLLAETTRRKREVPAIVEELRAAKPAIVAEARRELDESFPAPEPRPRVRQHVPAGSPAEIAARIRRDGARREATIVETGERVADGGIKR